MKFDHHICSLFNNVVMKKALTDSIFQVFILTTILTVCISLMDKPIDEDMVR